VVEKVIKVEMIFYSSAWWKSDGPVRVAYDSDADSMLYFRLEREGD
jgi:hypothetical protein